MRGVGTRVAGSGFRCWRQRKGVTQFGELPPGLFCCLFGVVGGLLGAGYGGGGLAAVGVGYDELEAVGGVV